MKDQPRRSAILRAAAVTWPTPTTFKVTRKALTDMGCALPVYDAEQRACSQCVLNQECAQASVYYLRDEVEPRIRKKYYPGKHTLDEAVVTIQHLRLFETMPKGIYSPEEVSDIFRTHDPVLIREIIKKLQP